MIVLTFIYCDARQDCYDKSDNIRVQSGICEASFILNYNRYGQNINEIPPNVMLRMLLVCYKQGQDRKECDSKSQYWPLPNNFNQGKDRGL